jgi:hypothetical protein
MPTAFAIQHLAAQNFFANKLPKSSANGSYRVSKRPGYCDALG